MASRKRILRTILLYTIQLLSLLYWPSRNARHAHHLKKKDRNFGPFGCCEASSLTLLDTSHTHPQPLCCPAIAFTIFGLIYFQYIPRYDFDRTTTTINNRILLSIYIGPLLSGVLLCFAVPRAPTSDANLDICSAVRLSNPPIASALPVTNACPLVLQVCGNEVERGGFTFQVSRFKISSLKTSNTQLLAL